MEGQLHNVRIICPEPSPDALKAIAASGALSSDIYYLCFNAYQAHRIGLMPMSFRAACDTAFKNLADATQVPVTPTKESAPTPASSNGNKKATNPTPPAETPRPGGPIWQSL